LPAAKFALTDTAPDGIVNVVEVENLLASVTAVSPDPVRTSQCERAFPDGGVAVNVTAAPGVILVVSLTPEVAVTAVAFGALILACAPAILFVLIVAG